MTSQGENRGPHEDLREAVASGQLSAPLQKQAEDILARIERPVRLGAVGLPGSGKTTLLNLLLGVSAIPKDVRLPTTQFIYGPEPRAICTLADGTKQTLDASDMVSVVDLNPAFVEAELPLPALQKLSMLEVVAGDSQFEQQRAVQWASKRLDIALWCSAGAFSSQELDVWAYAPERLQDHSFLMLTKTDIPCSMADFNKRVSSAKAQGEEYFKQILPIGTEAAIAARKDDGTVDKEALKKSGGMALISAILRDVEAGRETALDQALIFLRQIDFAPGKAAAPEPTPAPEPTVAEDPATAPEAAPAPEATVEPESAEEAPVVAEETAVVEAAPEPTADTEPEPLEEAAHAGLSEASRPVLEQAVDQLTEEGSVMLEALEQGELDDAAVVETCVETVTWLAEYLSDGDEIDDPLFTQSRDAAVDAADLVQLISLEPGASVASDALSVMIQLKQDMQMKLAA